MTEKDVPPLSLDEMVDRLDSVAVDTADQMIQEAGLVPPPSVHLLLDEVDPPYLGYVRSREFHRGEDAARAVTGLGLFGSLFGVSRMVVSWEYCDLAVALEEPDADAAPMGIVVLDATPIGHTVRWHPMRLHAGPVVEGVQTVRPEWGEVRRYENGDLPRPVESMLRVWRTPNTMSDLEISATCAEMEAGGYSVRWVERDPLSPQPGWMRLMRQLREMGQ